MSSIPRFARRAAAQASSNPSWSCFFCQRTGTAAGAQWQPTATATSTSTQAVRTTVRSGFGAGQGAKRFFSGSGRRRAQHQQQQGQGQGQGQQSGRLGGGGAAPGMDRMSEVYKRRNRSTAYYTISIILGTVAFSYGSVPMYKMICQTTGWGGQPVRAHGGGSSSSSSDPDFDLASRLEPVTDAKRIRVTFSSSVSDVLPWKFTPQQREVRVLPGETALAFYTATNTSDKDIIGVATYSVTPAQTAPYFSKIQCFCFEEQRLAAGETVDMPVFFYLDPDLLKDLNMRGVETVTLNYTFFKARYDENGKFKGAPGF